MNLHMILQLVLHNIALDVVQTMWDGCDSPVRVLSRRVTGV